MSEIAMPDLDFICKGPDLERGLATRELTGWETVRFELADAEPEMPAPRSS